MERLLQIGGTAVGLLGGFLTGLWATFLSPPHTVGVLAPVLAVAGNAALVRFTLVVTGRRGLAARGERSRGTRGVGRARTRRLAGGRRRGRRGPGPRRRLGGGRVADRGWR